MTRAHTFGAVELLKYMKHPPNELCLFFIKFGCNFFVKWNREMDWEALTFSLILINVIWSEPNTHMNGTQRERLNV